MPTPESTLKKDVQEALTKAGVRWFRMQSGKVKVMGGWMQLHPEGTADFLVCTQDRPPCWIELKAPGQKTAKDRREKQETFAEQMRCLGHFCFLCTSVREVMAAVEEVRGW